MNDLQLAFIGGGNMASAIIGGLVAQGFPAARITAADPSQAALDKLASATGIRTSTDNAQALAGATAVVLAVKPQVMKQVLTPVAGLLSRNKPLVISIAAGIRADSIAGWTDARLPIVRCMPNTPALVRAGITALYARDGVSAAQRAQAEQVLGAVGETLWVADEGQLDAVTAVSGSGPAYFFLVMEAMQAAAESLGLEPAVARRLTLQTALGAARLAVASDEPVAQLRRNVTSPGGTTERAIGVLEDAGLRGDFQAALQAACARSRELAQALAD